MKKLAMLLAFIMIVSAFPAVSVNAADTYVLKGLSEGEHIIANVETSRNLTLVDAAKANNLPTNATGVEKVVFTYNNEEAVEDTTAPYEYELIFDSIGEQTLSYEVYPAGGAAPIEKTVSFTTIAGKQNEEYSTPEESFSSLTDVTKFYHKASGSGVSAVVENGKFVFTKTATSGAKQFALKAKPIDSGNAEVQYYEFDFSATAGFTMLLRSGWASGSSDMLYNTVSQPDIALNETYKVGLLFDFNIMTAIMTLDGKELKRVPLTSFKDGSGTTPYLHLNIPSAQMTSLTIDNYKHIVYDEKEPQTFKTASINGGENYPVVTDLPEIRITGTDFLAGQILSDYITIEPAVSFNADIEGKDLVISFTEELSVGTSYSLMVDGVKDKDLLEYESYILEFRTLREGENPLPVVEILTPETDSRYYPGDEITIRANASDANGTVSYVEFYVDGVLIDGSRVETPVEDNAYEYIWVPDDIDSFEPVSITAVAEDDEGGKSTSSPVSILILSKQYPEVEITGPEDGTSYVLSLGGITSEVIPSIEFTAADTDGVLSSVEFFIDGMYDGALEDLTATSYKFSSPLTAGEHILTILVTDDDGQTAESEIVVYGEILGKAYPGLIDDTPVTKDVLSKWKRDGYASFSIASLTDYNYAGLLIKSDSANPGSESSVSRSYAYSLATAPSQADIKLAFGDTATERKVTFGPYELMTFTKNGKITYGEANIGEYSAGVEYNISAVVDTTNSKLYVMLDGEQIASAATIALNDFTAVAPLKVTHNSDEGVEGETVVISASISRMQEAVSSADIKFYDKDGQKITSLDTVACDLDYITVDIEGGVDESSLDGSLVLKNTATGRTVSLEYKDGKFYVNEILKSAAEYKAIMFSSVKNREGKGYSGAYSETFVTEATQVGVKGNDVKLTIETDGGEQVLDALPEEGALTANLNVTFNVTDSAAKDVIIVCAVYEGSFMKNVFMSDSVTVSSSNLNVTVPVSGVELTKDTVIEAFVVDNMDDLNPVSDTIFRID